MDAYGYAEHSTDLIDDYNKRNSRVGQFKQTMSNAGRAVQAKVAKPAKQALDSSIDYAKNNKIKLAGRVALPAIEAYDAYDDINSGHLKTPQEKYNRAAEGVTRLGGAATGAKLGSMVPIPHPLVKGGAALAGGAAGYFAPEALQALASKFGIEGELPSQKVSRLSNEATPKPALPAPNVQAGGGDKVAVGEGEMPKLVNLPKAQQSEQTAANPNEEMVKQALADLRKTLSAPADAATIGDAVAQKSRNKLAMDLLNATLGGVNQLDRSAANAVDIQKGQQGLAQGEFELAKTKRISALGEQLQKITAKDDPDGSQRQALQTQLLTLMGKAPDSPYKFITLNDGVNGERLVVGNQQTGDIQDAQATAAPQYEDGARVKLPDGGYAEYDAKSGKLVRIT